MAEKIFMIALSPTMDEGTIVTWNKKEGDSVEPGDVLCEVETDKAVMDLESTTDGIILKILVEKGQKATVGNAIAIIGEEGEDISDILTTTEPIENDNIDKNNADEKADQPIANVDKLSNQKANKSNPNIDNLSNDRIKASPLAKKMAESHGLSLDKLDGTGPKGRIVKADIEKAMDQRSTDVGEEINHNTYKKSDEIIPVSGKRRVIAKRLSESMFSAPHYYLKVTVAVDELITARKLLNDSQNQKVSFNSFLIKFSAELLKRHPIVHSTWMGDTIVRHGIIDIGLAVAQPDGLITPVIRDCGNKGIMQIEEELKILIQKAQNNNLKPEEYEGATFTISNLGSYGIEEFTAIINPPGSAILAVGEIKKIPVVSTDGSYKAQDSMKLTLSCDHRVIDGVVGAKFLKEFKDAIETPVKLFY